MYFTREPIIETVISSKEGYKLALRNSKGQGHEEYHVDAVEVISFGKNCFYRSLDRPKAFILPISDYEIVEVRETKMVLKTPALEKGGIKIGGGKEGMLRPVKEEEESSEEGDRREKKRDRRRFRKRKEREEEAFLHDEPISAPVEKGGLIPPPTTLISETISRYKELPVFAGAFFAREEKEEEKESLPPEEGDSNL